VSEVKTVAWAPCAASRPATAARTASPAYTPGSASPWTSAPRRAGHPARGDEPHGPPAAGAPRSSVTAPVDVKPGCRRPRSKIKIGPGPFARCPGRIRTRDTRLRQATVRRKSNIHEFRQHPHRGSGSEQCPKEGS
jgi:hypothetical protein